jgi:hypothetical protein
MYSVLSYSRKQSNQEVGGRWISQVPILSVTQATVFEGFFFYIFITSNGMTSVHFNL